MTKECSQFSGTDGAFCTITSSNLAALEVGSRVTYATVNGFGDLDSDVVLDLPGAGNNAAFGHCTLNASVSRCVFSGGTGKFTHFRARVDVSYLGGPDYGWAGTYTFSPRQAFKSPSRDRESLWLTEPKDGGPDRGQFELTGELVETTRPAEAGGIIRT